MLLTFRQLEILLAIADAESLSGAAARLGISQPSVSEAAKRIEAELGVRLFNRRGNGAVLTEDGRHAALVAREMVRNFTTALESIANRATGLRRRIVLAGLPSISCAIVPRAVRDFQRSHLGIEICLHDVVHERAVALVKDGVADMAITIRPPNNDDFDFHPLGTDMFALICNRTHPLALKRRVTWKEIARHPFVALAQTSSVRRITDAAFIAQELAMAPRYEVEQIPSAAALVAGGLGVLGAADAHLRNVPYRRDRRPRIGGPSDAAAYRHAYASWSGYDTSYDRSDGGDGREL